MADDVDFAKEIGTRSLFCYARTKVKIYHIIQRLGNQCKRKYNRELTPREKGEIYAAIRYYRVTHGLCVKTGHKRKYERLEGDNTYERPETDDL